MIRAASRCGIALALVAASLGIAAETPPAGGASTVVDTSREAYGQPSPVMPRTLRDTFFRGRGLFRQVWVVAPALDRDVSGLGPMFNRPSCAACHLKNGRGRAPDASGEKMTTMLVRLSLPGEDAHGAPHPHPAYGDQLNDSAVPGIAAEGQARLRWHEHAERFADGEEIRLRRPEVVFSELAYGPLGDNILISPRIAPPVFGLGLLEAVPEQALLDLAALPKPHGVRGRPNRVWDPEQGRSIIGRFGWKANAGTLRQQTAAAFLGDLGITSPPLPQENCTQPQTACRGAPSAAHPELEDARLQSVVLYQQMLAVPARRNVGDPQVMHGEKLFGRAGCESCHVPGLRTALDAALPMLAGQTIRPYSDLLLHDMGEGLADGRPDHLASGREWRTPPLWGIGLSETVNGHAAYLHDGRARSLAEAILWHGGEATAAREAFRHMDRTERDALLRFLQSL